MVVDKTEANNFHILFLKLASEFILLDLFLTKVVVTLYNF